MRHNISDLRALLIVGAAATAFAGSSALAQTNSKNLNIRYNLIQSDHRQLQVFATADNLFDKDSPIDAIPMAGGGGVPYDLIGRTFRIGARLTL